ETAERRNGRAHARLEVALLIEHAVIRQRALTVLRDDLPVRDQRGRVVDELALILGIAEHDADAGDVRAHALERRLDAVPEAPVKQQILRRVARQRELWEQNELGAELVARARGGVEHLVRVLVDAADAGIELRERDLHAVHPTREAVARGPSLRGRPLFSPETGPDPASLRLNPARRPSPGRDRPGTGRSSRRRARARRTSRSPCPCRPR